MDLDPEFLAALRCPLCRGELVQRQSELWCQESRKAYPIEDGIPVLLAEEARDLTDSEAL